jgi:hypothetical protein
VLELAAAAAAKSTSAWDQPGTLGFLVVFGMAVVLYFVFRSLAKHLRKINEAARLEAMRAEAAEAGTGETPGNGAQTAGPRRAGTGPQGSSTAT